MKGYIEIYPLSKESEIGVYGYTIKEMKEQEVSMEHKFIIFNFETGIRKEIYSGLYRKVDLKALKS